MIKILKLPKTFLILIAILSLILLEEKAKTLEERTNLYLPFLDLPQPTETPFKDIYFDLGDFRFREDSIPVLNENVEIMKKNPDVNVVIEGYCNKGEYNLDSNLAAHCPGYCLNHSMKMG